MYIWRGKFQKLVRISILPWWCQCLSTSLTNIRQTWTPKWCFVAAKSSVRAHLTSIRCFRTINHKLILSRCQVSSVVTAAGIASRSQEVICLPIFSTNYHSFKIAITNPFPVEKSSQWSPRFLFKVRAGICNSTAKLWLSPTNTDLGKSNSNDVRDDRRTAR